jgi:very-short-patch-repair endonuclease
MSHADRIRQLLFQKPGLKAQQIADELRLDRSQVATALHRLLGGEAVQDNAYRWWPKSGPVRGAGANGHDAGPRTLLASLCRYYLACLARESGPAVSIAAADSGGYIALNSLPFAPRFGEGVASDRVLKKIIQKVRRERGQLALYLGYALRLRCVRLKDEEELRIEPVLLYRIEDATEERSETLRPASGIPLFNLEVLKGLPAADSGNVMDEAIHLSEELGLANTEDDLPPWDEIILRLQRCRPEWEWREDLNPYELSQGTPLTELPAAGIYNRAVLFAGTRSPFTYGLEMELHKLAELEEEAVRDTALGQWLRGAGLEARPAEDRPLLEVLPLNTEQRQAVVQGLSAPLTIVTGPPGTGKSQVVTSLLANLAWQGGSALFSSKNNHAVDVVETRVNGLGPHPLLLRLGKEEHHARIAQQVAEGLAASSTADDSIRYRWLAEAHEQERVRYGSVQREMESAVQLRNAVDELERAVEPARALFDAERFRALRSIDVPAMAKRAQDLGTALDEVLGSGWPPLIRVLRAATKDRRAERFATAVEAARREAERLGLNAPDGEPGRHGPEVWRAFQRALAQRLDWAARVQAYWAALDRLREVRPIEHLATELTRIAEASAQNALDLWHCWLRIRPSRWSLEQRKTLSEYVALLQMIAGGEQHDGGSGRRVFRRYYQVFPKVTPLLPCWAVTSLSARGRLPFTAGLFDLVVIDEASQCDIASALPLLFRARRAVIIGDPLQLKHVSAVAPQQDRLILAAHGLAEGRAAWAYSVNSLFDLARGLCRHEDIVNLRDHHRSHRDIIAFSNRHFYRGGLRVATDHASLKRPHAGPAVRWVEAKGRVARPAGGGALNTAEAAAVVAEVRKLIIEQGYDGAVGVVTPFRAHANRIRTLVHQDAELARQLAPLQFVVDTVHGFQGDERDVMFFSPVVSAGISESAVRFLNNHSNLFNVAVTRARSELVVVGDRQAALDSGISYLASFAEYAQTLVEHESSTRLFGDLGPEYPPVTHPELVSDWERIFYRALYDVGLRPVPQYEEAPHTLDFALFDDERRLDIELDGENYHRNWDGELCRRDQLRSRRLSDLGWDIMRFWVYEIRDDLEGSVRRVRAWRDAVAKRSVEA